MLEPFDKTLTRRLLRHIGFDGPHDHPSPGALRALHRTFLQAVPYENLEIQLHRPTTIRPVESAERILTGRGGYCYHLNGTFATLLSGLGYDVTLVSVDPRTDDPEAWGWHLPMLVKFPDATYLADVGFGDGFIDPLPLVEGTANQGPFQYAPERRADDVWRFYHDPRGTLDGFDLRLRPMPLSAFEAKHRWWSTAPESSFVKTLVVQSRRADHVLILRGCLLTRVDGDGKHSTDVETKAEWCDVIRDEFGIQLPDDDAAFLRAKARDAHQRWLDAGRP